MRMSNHFNNVSVPSFILCKANKDRVGVIKCTDKKLIKKFNDCDEISFTTYLYNNNIKNKIYDKVSELQYIEIPTIGRYIIGSIHTVSEGTKFEYKECTALSSEVVLAQKYLEEFKINMGTVESIDGVQLYNLAHPDKSLLHLVLEKYPDWEIGHVDNELYTIQRCFEITRQDVYSFLTDDIAKAFQCIFTFDTLNYRINVYKEDNIGDDTNIHVSYNNLLKSTNISSNIDEIKTCLTVLGADDLNLREVNMGYKEIYNIDYFHDLDFMSQGLYDAYTKWKKKWNDNVSIYENLVTQYQNFYKQIHYLESEKMPTVSNSTNWTEYGLIPLKEQLSAYEQKQAVMIKAGQGVSTHKDYNSLYLPCYNSIQAIKSQIIKIESQIANLKTQQTNIGNQMDTIISSLSMMNNFTLEQREELSNFIREEELSSSNYVVTDTMTDAERMDMLHEMLDYGREELSKISQPTLQFSCDMANIFAVPEFNSISDKFDVGNYIHISLRDDFIVKARMLTIEINLYDENDFVVTFGNIMKLKKSKLFQDITNALSLAKSTATSVSFNSSNWNQSNKDTSTINKMLADGLLAAGQSLKNAKSDILIDNRGILVSNTPESKYPNDRIFIGNSQILFSDDDLKTIKTALGRVKYTKKGVTYDDFGLLAQFVIAGYIASSVIEGNEILGGTIKSNNYSAGKYGSYLNLNNGTFEFNGNGEKKLYFDGTTLAVKGTIKAEDGYIGGINGFTIKNGKFYSGSKNSFSSNNAGVYIGTDGISLGQNNPFHVNSNGYFVSTSGKIANFNITNNYLANGTTSLGGANNSVYLGIDGISLGTTFKVTKAGVLTATSGKIANFNITNNYLANGTTSLGGANNSVYLGIDGISLGTTFKVTKAGKLVTTNGSIGGWTITSNKLSASGIDISSTGYIMATNGNWRINADGTATFKNVFITGVQRGSQFGNVSYTDNGTYGDFNNGLHAGTSFGLGGGALNNFNDLVANKVTANYIDATVKLSAKYATIKSLDAAKARIDTIESNYISANEVSANYATIGSLNAAKGEIDNLKSASINVNRLKAGNVNGHDVYWQSISYCDHVTVNTSDITIDGRDKTVVTAVKPTFNTIYVMAG